MKNTQANFEETIVLEGWTRKATQLFTDEKSMLKPIIYHYFTFSFEYIKYEFKVFDEEQKLHFSINNPVDILFDVDKMVCIFLDETHNVVLWEEEEMDT